MTGPGPILVLLAVAAGRDPLRSRLVLALCVLGGLLIGVAIVHDVLGAVA